MNKKKAFSFLLALFLLIITVSIKDVNAAESFKMEMNVTKSGGGIYEVRVNVTNDGPDFTGTLRVVVRNSTYNLVGYDVDISIPKNAEKEYTVYIPVKSVRTNENVQGIILDKSKKIKYSNSFRGVFNQYSGIIETGILSDNPGDLSFLDLGGAKIGNDTADKRSIKLVELSANSLKKDLEYIQMLIIDDYDTSTIDAETMASIETWTQNGGILVLGTGGAAKKVLSGFNKKFVYIYYDVGTVDYLKADGSDYISLDYASIVPGGGFEYREEGQLIAIKDYGCVGVIPYKLADFKDYTDEGVNILSTYYNGLLSYGLKSGMAADYDDTINVYELQRIFSYMEKPANTSVPVLVAILLIYVVMVGPIIYLILKAMKKQETIWYVIPGIAILFVGFVFILSFSVRVRGLTLRSISLVNLDSQSENNYIMGYNPKPGEWTVKTKNAYKTANVLDEDGYRNNNDVAGTVKLGGENALTYNAYESFDLGAFVYPSISSTEGVFDMNLELDPNTPFTNDSNIIGEIEGSNSDSPSSVADYIRGSITNNSGMNFDYVLVCLGDKYQLIENMNNGDNVSVNIASQLALSYSSDISSDIAKKPYMAKEYDKAAELGALSIAYEAIGNSYNNNITDVIVIGVREQDGLTDKNEPSWMCCYSKRSSLY